MQHGAFIEAENIVITVYKLEVNDDTGTMDI